MKNQALQNDPSNDLVDRFVLAFQSTATKLAETGRLLCEIADTVPDWLQKIREKLPGIAIGTIKGLLKIGRGEIDERLCLSEAPGVKKLRGCDIALQHLYLAEPIQVLSIADGKEDILLVQVFEMDAEQARQVFDRGTVRTAEQQRIWLRKQKPKIKNAVIDKAYDVRGKKLIALRPCEFTAQQLLAILQEMT